MVNFENVVVFRAYFSAVHFIANLQHYKYVEYKRKHLLQVITVNGVITWVIGMRKFQEQHVWSKNKESGHYKYIPERYAKNLSHHCRCYQFHLFLILQKFSFHYFILRRFCT